MTDQAPQFDLDLFYGAAAPAEARVYARVMAPKSSPTPAPQIAGRLVGPSCKFASTLPARLPFRGVGNDASGGVLAEAIVPDPCFWTPELPFLYRAELDVACGPAPAQPCHTELGIRRFGPRGRDLHFEGKRFVLRGGSVDESSLAAGAPFARESWTACVLPNPSDESCRFASQRGIFLVADLTTAGSSNLDGLPDELRRLAQWPAVLIVLLDRSATVPQPRTGGLRNLVLGQSLALADGERPRPWAQVAFVDVHSIDQRCSSPSALELPVVARRKTTAAATLPEIRAAADRLQRELAPLGDFAGYLV